MKNRAGKFITQAAGYKAFIPNPLPPEPPLRYDDELQTLLSQADRALARLDGIATVLPNPDLFIGMYVKKEALLSSQIEGTQASLEGVLEFEADLAPKGDMVGVLEVINYINAMNYGIERLKEFPMSLRLIKDVHKLLIEGTRGSHRAPGEFRRSQNWIGLSGATLNEAAFIPPPPSLVTESMGDLEKFFYAKDTIPPLVKISLIHAQFETIHPFLDGSGRIGRLLITFYLVWKEILSKTLLYISCYLKKYRSDYYDLLEKIRTEGAWEEWIKFFLKGVYVTSAEAAATAREIMGLKEKLHEELYSRAIASIYGVKLVDLLFAKPVISVNDIIEGLRVSKETASELVKKFEAAGILTEITGKKRYRKYAFRQYVAIIGRGTQDTL
ncbi:MAG TPA: Fic family protein [Syntrophorhabdales bacterium]|nr:Fic family protein [Syntrophorhabdales bacterium]